MITINLRDIFPEYTLDCFIEVPDSDATTFLASLTREIADVYIAFQRTENNYILRTYRNRAWYSLDCGDDIEADTLYPIQSPESIFEANANQQALYAALMNLPEKQARRIYAHYFLRMSKAEIARAEGLAERTVGQTIERGIANLKKYLEKH